MHIGKSSGQLDENFIRKALVNGHVRAAKYRADRVLYHLGSKPLYDLIGETDNRNRRQHQVFTIKCRLMALDFVLQHQTCRFYATEREKVNLFCGSLQLDVTCLPKKRYRAASRCETTDRFFVDKFPIYKSEDSSIVHFTFIDEGLHSTVGFETFLLQYERLLRELTKSRIIYIAAHPGQFPSAKRLFERFRVKQSNPPPVDPQVRRLIAYFHDRSAYERREFGTFTQAKLIQFREDRNTFAGVEFERMFEDWQRGGDEAVLTQSGSKAASDVRSISTEFGTHLLPFDYKLFGTLGEGNWQGRPA